MLRLRPIGDCACVFWLGNSSLLVQSSPLRLMERKDEAGLAGDWFDSAHIRLGFDEVLGRRKGESDPPGGGVFNFKLLKMN